MTTVEGSVIINDRFTTVLNKLDSGLKQSTNSFRQFKQQMAQGSMGNFGSKFKAGFNQLDSGVKQSSGLFKSMLGANVVGAGITKGVGMAANGIKSIVGELDDSSKAWQTFNGNMNQLGSSPKQINSARDSMQDFAQKTIYSASDMASTYSQLAAVGTKNTGQLVKGFGGLAAASSDPAQAMKTLSQQATQMAAMPKVQWADFKLMLQQTPAGISVVAKTMHKSSAQLVKDIQGGKVSTQDFFNAISKAGTNANFSKMATQFKTVGQAMDGLKENIGIKLLPAYQALSKVGIKAISGLADSVSDMDFSGIQTKLVSVANGVVSGVKTAGTFISEFWSSMAYTSTVNAVTGALSSLGGAMKNIGNAFSGSNGIDNLASSLGRLAGAGITGAANTIKSVSDAVKQMSPGQIKAAAIAIGSLAASFKAVGLIKGGMDLAGKLGLGKLGTAAATAVTGVKNAFKGGNISGAIRASFSGVGSIVSAAFSPVTLVIVTITAVIAAGVAAWTSNFMNIRGVVEGLVPIFGIVGSAVKSAFSNIAGTLAPLAPAIRAVGAVVIGVLAIGFVTASVAALALVAAGQMVVGVISAIVHDAMALKDVLTGNFSGAAKEFAAASDSLQNGFDGAKNSITGIGKVLGTVKDSLGQIGKSNPKVKVKADTSDLTTGLDKALASGGSKTSTVKVKGDTTQLTNSLDLATKTPKNSTVKVKGDTTGLTNSLDLATKTPKNSTVKVKGDTSELTNSLDLATKTPKASTVKVKGDTSQLTSSMNQVTGSKKNSTVNIKGDTTQLTSSLNSATSSKKAATVKVNADTTQLRNSMNLAMPVNKTSKMVKIDADTSAVKQKTAALGKPVKGGTVKYDTKVAKPKVPQPTMPKLSQIDAPKVGKPKVPQPAKVNVAQISAPKVGKPKTPQPTKPKASTIAAPKVGKPKTPQPTKVKATNIAAPKVGKPRVPQPARITIPALAAPKVRRPSMAPVVSAVRAGMASAVSAVRSGGAQMAGAVRSAVSSAASAARSGAGAMRSAGAMIGAGLAGGMRSQVGSVAAAANALVAQANRAARAAAKIHSPSRLFAEIGDYMGQGMAVGMNGSDTLVAAAGTNLASVAAKGASDGTPVVNANYEAPSSIPTTTPFNKSVSNSYSTTTNNGGDNSSSTILNIAAGAIQVVNRNGDETGEEIARKLEEHLKKIHSKSMSSR
ncbi:tape measure protein [Lactiplantibacillus sp. WILCCON 0030]|uniref:Tape measure protein n=1 Tax=Lactiplantibacillus brownii TaxID=3069269 RepID=A0ABU1A853_9LACO|nr:tape measure protein [Lactiplantibacillus brownii]MDQ7937106.1 tape measure protein [Lactiplantibacillus brownii]